MLCGGLRGPGQSGPDTTAYCIYVYLFNYRIIEPVIE